MIEYGKVLGMKVSVVAYEDNDPKNTKGPINSEVFRICWEQLGKPRDFWDMQEIVSTNITAANYFPISQHLMATVKIYDAKLPHGWEILSGNIAACPVYFSIESFAGNQTSGIFKEDKLLLPS